MSLPPGATLVSGNMPQSMALPPGAELVSPANPASAAQGTNKTDAGVIAGVKRNSIGMVQGLWHAFTDPATDQEKSEIAKKVDRANVKGEEISPELAANPTRVQLAYHRLIDAPAEELEQKGSNERAAAKDLLRHGKIMDGANTYLSGVTDSALSLVPVMGPAINSIATRYEKGDHSGAAVDMAGLLTPQIVEGVRQFQPVRAVVPAELPEKLYKGALKPSTTLPPEKVAGMVKAGLENEIPVSAAGVEKLSDLIDDLNAKVKDVIDQGARQGKTVNKFSVASRLGDTAHRFATQVNPVEDLNAVAESGNEFLNNQPTEIPADKAQALKTGTYKQLKGRSYGELKSASVESQKSLARGIKEELAAQFPELKDLNANESKLIDLDGALERAVNRISNHQLIGIGTPIAAGAAKAVTGSSKIGALAGMLKAVIDDPFIKSKVAIALSRKGVPPLGAIKRIATYSAALGNAANDAMNGDQTKPQGSE